MTYPLSHVNDDRIMCEILGFQDFVVEIIADHYPFCSQSLLFLPSLCVCFIVLSATYTTDFCIGPFFSISRFKDLSNPALLS